MFGLQASSKSPVYQPLITAENALVGQSKSHSDGWGMVYFEQGVPHLVRGLKSAQEDTSFRRLAEGVSTNALVAHLRRATVGEVSLLNCHPFQFGRWAMAHNGNLPEFQAMRAKLTEELEPHFLSNVFGTTDSEIYFALILQELERSQILTEGAPAVSKCASAFRRSVEKIEMIYQKARVTGDLSLNVILSNGSVMLGFRYHRELNFNCDLPSIEEGQKVTRFMLSSEPLTRDHTWHSLK
ncbi:MAG: class II glutamine amidotransferase, partial [Minisyncoccia bacterium]